jgi:riboflavin kinase/FMN adenylyltransferase
VLASRLSARVVVVGQNFRFGKARQGDFDALVHLGERLGFETRTHPLVGDAAGPWSSTRIRGALGRGDLDAAAEMLGRPHMISGVVVAGDRRGRTIGFPTANLDEVEEALPPWGVYAVLVDREEAGARAAALAKGVANIGVRPTVKPGATGPSVEVHLFDWSGDLYGERLRVHLIERLRPEQKFAGIDELKAQIGRDAAAARARLSALEPAPEARGAYR